MKKLNLLLLSFFLSAFVAFGQNPSVVNGVATYHSNINVGRKFQVPNSWNKIVIKKNVTITGSFYMPTRTSPIEIMGEDRKTSIIQGDGSRPTDDGINGRSYSAIRADKSPDIYVHDLTVTKPMKFHIHGGFGNVTVERCDIVAGSYTHTTDGIHGGVGKTVVKDCYINCYDDALYTIECKLVEKTTIVHNKNGGPFMTSWGNDVPNGNVCVIRNCTVIAGHTGTDYNHGVVSWAGKSSASNVKETNTLKFEGTFEYIVPTGKKASTFYTIGRPNDSGINNAHIVIDGQCPYKNSINLRSSTNSSVTFKNCETAPISYTLTVNSGTGSGNLTAQSTKTITANAAPSGKVFDKWVVNSGNPSIANATDASTILTMPAGNATVTATYKDISINITPTDITNLSARAVSCNSVELSWGDVQGEEAYRVRRKTATTNYIILADVPANTTSYVDETAEENTTYQYMVRPMKGGVAVAVSNSPQILTEVCNTDPIPVDDFIKAYPNPTTGILTLPEVLANDQIKIVSQLSGTTVLTKTIQQNGSTQLDITSQPSGNYVIQIVRNNQLLTRLIIKL